MNLNFTPISHDKVSISKIDNLIMKCCKKMLQKIGIDEYLFNNESKGNRCYLIIRIIREIFKFKFIMNPYFYPIHINEDLDYITLSSYLQKRSKKKLLILIQITVIIWSLSKLKLQEYFIETIKNDTFSDLSIFVSDFYDVDLVELKEHFDEIYEHVFPENKMIICNESF
jgi:hypothetical protein